MRGEGVGWALEEGGRWSGALREKRGTDLQVEVESVARAQGGIRAEGAKTEEAGRERASLSF